jgi:uncharacterized coiled-coil DUF342 family protein
MGGTETMTEKRYKHMCNDFGKFTIHSVFDTETKEAYGDDNYQKIVDLLNEQNQKIKETKDMFYEVHKQQQDCLKEVIKLKEEKRELEFKLGTLIKAYSHRNCAFNGKETEYLKSLRK